MEVTVTTKYTGKGIRCEGWRRKGGMMTLGNPEWRQCQNEATVKITFKQGKEPEKELPGCSFCWEDCERNDNIKIVSVTPLIGERK